MVDVMMLADKVAIVTGAAAGIGRAIALAFAREGAHVVLADVNGAGVAQVQLEARQHSPRSCSLQADVTERAQVEAMVAQAVGTFGRIDILVNNAGGGGGVSGLMVSDEDWDRVIELNLKSHFMCCRAVVPQMERQGYGRIVNISSNAGKYRSNVGTVGGIAYAAAKGGILQFTRSTAYALGRSGITVNAIAPGSVLTDAGQREYDSLAPERRDRVIRETPLNRFAQPDEIAQIAVFLASEDASYVTGATILASGGWCSS
jgi:NAD(P)-dependent dehydrogenase (short-subunit alcohol dehydrogenase family)